MSIPIARPVLGPEEHEALRQPLETGWVTQGPKVAEFENSFAKMHQVNHALAVTSCTTGLHLALAGLEIGPGDEVIVPSFTWVASANVVRHVGATPVLVDVDVDTYNIDIDAAAAAVTPRTRAVMAVHLFGLCADVPALRAAVGAEIAIVEDAACAAGARHGDVHAGALGDVAAFSFHPRKVITTGEGGMVTTDDAALADRMTKLRNHGSSVPEEVRHHGPKPWLLADHDLVGFNFRMTDLQGAVGVVQLGRLDGFIEGREKLADRYVQELGDLDWLHLPPRPVDGRHGWQAFVCRVDEAIAPMTRNEMMEQLGAAGVSTRPGTHAVHLQGAYRSADGRTLDLPVSERLDAQTLAIPFFNGMAESEVEQVISSVRALA